MNSIPRIVIDTQILLRALINRRSLPAKIVFDYVDNYILLMSDPTLAEVDEVVHRPKIRQKFGFTDSEIEALMQRLGQGEKIGLHEITAISRDPKDDKFLACALTGNASYLISEDADLLVLNPYHTVQIINVLDFWHILKPPQPD